MAAIPAGLSASTIQRNRIFRQQESSNEMAEILRAWDDEDDEMVEFIQSSKNFGGGLDKPRFKRTAANGTVSESSSQRSSKYSSTTVRTTKTLCLFVSFFGLGTTVAILGPTLLDLSCHTHTNLQRMSYVFTCRSVGYLTGSIAGGWLFDKYNGHLVLSLSCTWGTVMMLVLPYVRNLYGLVTVVTLLGVACGSLDTGGNVLLLSTWGKRSRPYLQALHFVFAIGAFVAPLIVQPFLLTECPDSQSNLTVSNKTARNLTNATQNTTSIDTLPVTWSYWIGSTPLVLAAVGFLVFVFMKSCSVPESQDQKDDSPKNHSSSLLYRMLILCLFSVFLLLYVGLEVAYGGYIFTFAVKSKPGMSKERAAFLTSGFWGSFALSRLAAVPLSRHLSPPRMLMVDLVGCLLASVILVSQFTSGCATADQTKLWLGTVILGISMASVFPAAISWTEYFMTVSGKTASVLVVSACFGEMVVPLAVGSTIATVGPCALMACTMAISVLTLTTYVLINVASRYFRRRGAFIGMLFQKKRNQDETDDEGQRDEVLRLLEQNNDLFNGEPGTQTS